MYDGSTAAAEACLMAHRITGKERVVISGGVNPRYTDVIETYASVESISSCYTHTHPDRDCHCYGFFFM